MQQPLSEKECSLKSGKEVLYEKESGKNTYKCILPFSNAYRMAVFIT